jgi:hypothetical protein
MPWRNIFPYWMAVNFQKYAGHGNELPVDAHFLISLIAPRPLFLNTGSEDRWGDPHGEFLAGRNHGRQFGRRGESRERQAANRNFETDSGHYIFTSRCATP